jgi:putative phosphoesterase
MRIGVVSDTHDRHEAVAEAVRVLTAIHQVELIIHCGDIESPETCLLFKPCPTHFVYGNWDKDRSKLAAAIKSVGGTPHDGFGALDLAGKRVAWCHSHERHQLYQLEHSNYFDYLFYGHTHVREQHRTGRTLVANPGALFRANPKTCIVLDVETGELKPIIVAMAKTIDTESSTVGSMAGSEGPGLAL